MAKKAWLYSVVVIAPFNLPAFNRSEVYRCFRSAGDTVVATIALALSTGATLPEAMALGSIAASIVVKKPGTAVTSQKEILDLLAVNKTTLHNICQAVNLATIARYSVKFKILLHF